jgi:poly(A) polymerase
MVILGTMEINHRSLGIAVVHLTSNIARDAAAKRQSQCNDILKWIQTFGKIEASLYTHLLTRCADCTERCIMGDFNFGDDIQLPIPESYKDMWRSLKLKDKGHTYDINNNPLAKITTKENYHGRFDRILIESGSWKPIDVSLFGTDPISCKMT